MPSKYKPGLKKIQNKNIIARNLNANARSRPKLGANSPTTNATFARYTTITMDKPRGLLYGSPPDMPTPLVDIPLPKKL